MMRNILNAERLIFIQSKCLQNSIQINIRKNANNFHPKYIFTLQNIAINSFGKRFASSDVGSTNNVIHKVLFVNAESPDSESGIKDNVNNVANTDSIAVSSKIDAESSVTADDLSFSINSSSSVAGDTSGVTGSTVDDAIFYIPPPPVPPEILSPPLNALGEQTFESLGLANWTPVGFVQSTIEYLHVTFNIPWWGTIMITTIVLRLLLSPLVIKSQRMTAKMSHHMPKVLELQQQMTEARQSGNNLEAARISYDLQKYMEVNNVQPLKSAMLPLAQAPIFISMFMGLRACANLPVESFKTGGMLWFTDLTVVDQYYLLPLITSATLFIVIKVNAEGNPSMTSGVIKYVMTALPFIMFPFIMNFPTALLCYWSSTNFFTLAQVTFIRIPAVSKYLNIGKIREKTQEEKKKSTKGFIGDMKDAYSNMKVSAVIDDRRKFDDMAFQKAGRGPLIRTFKHNPLNKKKVINVKATTKED